MEISEKKISNGKKIVNVVFCLNRACNLRCFHCCLSNEYKESKEIIKEEMLNNYFLIIDGFLEKHSATIADMTFLMSGGEVSMLSDEMFVYYGNLIFDYFEKTRLRYPDVEFSMITLSNLVDISLAKCLWIKEVDLRAKSLGLNYSMTTSFEKYSNRFSKPALFKRWEDNVAWFKNNGVNLFVLWSITKKDAEDATAIIKYFEDADLPFNYLAILPTGEGLKNDGVGANYEEFSNFLKTLYEYKFKGSILGPRDKVYSYDKVINLILDQNGFVMIDLVQDLVSQYEKHKNFNIDNVYIHKANKFIFLIDKDVDKSISLMNKMWYEYLKGEIKYYLKAGCFSCEFFNYCEGGIETFRPIYNTPGRCAGFKNVLEYFMKK